MVMEKSPHVLLIGDGAETFAVSQGAQAEDPSYFYTERRWQQLQTLLAEEAAADPSQSASSFIALDHSVKVQESPAEDFPVDNKAKFGTVGAVALDSHGNLAAATSTGGMSNKRWGRVGDSSIIGAGTYANNKTCAVSSTGHGEYYIRNVVAFRVSGIF
jgi:beta-aspartyl-peptidase (threonine type)